MNKKNTEAKPIEKRFAFKPRVSILDEQSQMNGHTDLRGFFSLFWWLLIGYVISTLVRNFNETGSVLGQDLGYKMFYRFYLLLIGDILMCFSTFIMFLLCKLVAMRILSLFIASILRYILHVAFLTSVVIFLNTFDFFWVQTGSFLMHALCLMMKMHSFFEVNAKMHSDMLSGKKEESVYPSNVTLYNYLELLCFPVLIYEIECPRTDKIRPMYIVRKLSGALFSMFLIYTTIEHYVTPILNTKDITKFEAIIHLTLPYAVLYMLLFFTVFECFCNVIAELTMFADRNFYDDWWNSASFDDFARRWNKPVHLFLLKHVYFKSINTNFSKQSATFITFLVSSIVHEFFMIVIGKKFKPYLFGFQMFQLPLIYFMRLNFFKEYPFIGNSIFWGGIFVGTPLITVLFCLD